MYATFMQDMQQNYFEKSSNILLPSLVDDGTNLSTRKWLQCITLDGIRKLFSQGRASPFDVSPTGRTPLHFAATAVPEEMIELLVKQHDRLKILSGRCFSDNPRIAVTSLTATGLSQTTQTALKSSASPAYIE
ncbi:hypothetical protein DL95DRAFT_458733 [Leptodontidium sp. 2 PMI_412]|nr:hypothetical protein DL95DRAFT_458733 [Leptodontidium sp. 2 PMI_412]